MQPSSTAFAEAITQNDQLVCAKAEVWSPPPNAAPLAVLENIVPSSNPAVTDDETQQTRRTATVTCVDNDGSLTPELQSDLLHPMSQHQIKLFRGLVLPGGPEYIPCGVYQNTTPVFTNLSDGRTQVDFTLNDMMQYLYQCGWLEPFFVVGDMSKVIYDTVNTFLPGIKYNLAVVNFLTQAQPGLIWGGLGSFKQGADPATNISGLATDVGMEVFFDAAGAFTFRSLVDPAIGVPSFTWVEGESCQVQSAPRTLDYTQWYNTICVEAGGAGIPVPIRSVVYLPPKPNPIIPYTYTSPNITSQAACNAAAIGLLYRLRYALELVTLTMTPDPRVNAGDTARLYFPRSKIDGVYHIQSVQLPLDATSQMQVVCRPIALAGLALTGIPVQSS